MPIDDQLLSEALRPGNTLDALPSEFDALGQRYSGKVRENFSVGDERIIVVTESGMLHRLQKEVPGKNLIAGPTDHCACADCRYMKMNTLEKLHACLETLEPQVELPEDIRARAEISLTHMLEQSK